MEMIDDIDGKIDIFLKIDRGSCLFGRSLE